MKNSQIKMVGLEMTKFNQGHKIKWEEPEKLTLEWGDRQAKAIWDEMFSRFELEWEGKSVLDFGCMWGYFCRFLLEEQKVRESVGIDILPKWEDLSDEWNYQGVENLELFAGDILDIKEIQGRKFDIITTAGTIFLLSPTYLEGVLNWMYDHLAPGGSLVLQTRTFFSYNGGDLHNITSIPFPQVIFSRPVIEKFIPGRERILNPMSATAFLMLFRRTGFEIINFRKGSGINEAEHIDMFRQKTWYYTERDLNTGDIFVHLKKPKLERDLSELRD